VVADVVASTHVGVKRMRAHVIKSAAAAPAVPAPAVPAPVAAAAPAPASVAAGPAPKPKKNRWVPSLGPKHGRTSPVGKKPVSRKKPVHPPPPPPPSANEVFEEVSAPTTSFMGLVQEVEVNIGEPPLDSFDFEEEPVEEEVEEEAEEEEEVTEINEAAFQTAQGEGGAKRPKLRSSNYSEVEDVLLVRAWSKIGMDAVHGTDQTGKRYWQRIEDKYCKLKPKTGSLVPRSYRSLQGRWEVIKSACARWSAAMDQVINNPPSGIVESDYVSVLNLTLWFISI
jgi:hypothetical protein